MPAPTLVTDRLVLRRFAPEDAGFIYKLFSHEDEMRFVPAGPMACEADALAYLEKEYLRWYRAADAGERGKYDTPLDLRFAICLKDDAAAGDAASGTSATADGAVSELAGAPIGYVNIDSQNDALDLGYGLSPAHWRRGYVAEAAGAVVEAARAAGFPFVTATHDVLNPHSGYVMQRLGMTYRYTYRERWAPRDIDVDYRLYQIDFAPDAKTYHAYWERYPLHWVETL